MDEFPFMINLNYKMNDFEIKPPSSLYHLKEVACSKYDLNLAEMVYINEEGDQMPLDTEEQYFEMISYATENKLDQIEIVIKKNENVSEKRKESLRKKSSMKNEYESFDKKGKTKLAKIKDEDEEDVKEGGNGGSDGEEVGMQCDYDYFGDTRNRKGMIGNEGYSKQNRGYKEDKRINYIKEKKKRQREEDLKKNQEEEEEEEDIDRNRKRIKKEVNKDDKNFENNTQEVGPKSNKKKKKPKKDKVRF